MAELYLEVKPIKVQYLCDNCDESYLKAEPYVFPTNPPQYPHVCPECGHEKVLRKSYPYIEYEEITE